MSDDGDSGDIMCDYSWDEENSGKYKTSCARMLQFRSCTFHFSIRKEIVHVFVYCYLEYTIYTSCMIPTYLIIIH